MNQDSESIGDVSWEELKERMAQWDKDKPLKWKSRYAGYEETARLLKPARRDAAAVPNPSRSGIPFTRLLDDVMPGRKRAAQVKRWNEVTGELWTVEDAERHRFHDQIFVKLARMSWESGLAKIENDKRHRELMKALEAPIPAARPDVPLRVLLHEFSQI